MIATEQLPLFPLAPAPADVLEVAEGEAAFCLGWMAGRCGQGLRANPYPALSRDGYEWLMGYQEGRAEATEPTWEWWAYLYPERFGLTEKQS